MKNITRAVILALCVLARPVFAGDDEKGKGDCCKEHKGDCKFRDKDKPPQVDNDEHKECKEWLHDKIADIKKRHEEGKLSCEEAKKLLEQLRAEARERCRKHEAKDHDTTPNKERCEKHGGDKSEKERRKICNKPALNELDEECREKLKELLAKKDSLSPEELEKKIKQLKEECRKHHKEQNSQNQTAPHKHKEGCCCHHRDKDGDKDEDKDEKEKEHHHKEHGEKDKK